MCMNDDCFDVCWGNMVCEIEENVLWILFVYVKMVFYGYG